ncbi:MAG: methyltransferase [Candidatus Aenigmarchaeota archaeon]|nr:methyltransferase [Candidatus Aenigmarchaeota archaeon]
MVTVPLDINGKRYDLDVFEDVYLPLEDSFLVAKHIKKVDGKNVLDIGCGSGILSVISAARGANVTAVDINEIALHNTNENAKKHKLKIKVKKSNLFSGVRKKFDLILFNPPYVPEDEQDRYLSENMKLALTSGLQGSGLIKKFLKEFEKYLKPDGQVLMIISSDNNLKLKGWKEIDSASFFFEKIMLMKYKNK